MLTRKPLPPMLWHGREVVLKSQHGGIDCGARIWYKTTRYWSVFTGYYMAESQIEWTDATWNPVAGCSLASAGCKNCYAMKMARRLEAMGVEKYAGLTQKRGRNVTWNGRIREDYAALSIPLDWRKPKKIFVNSMSDLFHPDVSDEFVMAIWDVMRRTPRHHYQILTKRPDRMRRIVSANAGMVLQNVWLGSGMTF